MFGVSGTFSRQNSVGCAELPPIGVSVTPGQRYVYWHWPGCTTDEEETDDGDGDTDELDGEIDTLDGDTLTRLVLVLLTDEKDDGVTQQASVTT